jgi:putative ABC transport system permease protein
MLRRTLQRLAAFVHPARAERELARELASHLALLEDEYRRRGLSDDEARRQARLALGGLDRARELHRDARSFPWLEDLRRDVPYAIRGLRRTPGFTAAAILTLGLGIGATVAIVSVAHAVILRPLPFPESDRLVHLTESAPPPVPGQPSPPRNITYAQFEEWRARTTMGPVAALRWDPQVMAPTPRGTARLSGGLVTPDWFDLLGTPAMLGRTLRPSDAAEGRNVVVLSARAWRQYFGSDPNVIGTSFTVHSRITSLMNGQAMEIVGVMPDDFNDPAQYFEFWAPLIIRDLASAPATSPAGVQVYGRLAPGTGLDAAAEEATTLFTAIRKAAGGPGADTPRQMLVTPVKTEVVKPVRPALEVLIVAVALVLVIVCANVACLLLARGSSRQREIAVRLAIGGSRGRIVRQLLTESAVLAAAGGLVGAAVGAFGIAMLRALASVEAQGVFRIVFGGNLLPRVGEIRIDPQVLGMAIALAAITCLAFGLVPALRASQADARQATSSRAGRPAGESRLQSALVVGQLTMATMLVIGATLLIGSFFRLAAVDAGYRPEGVLAFQLVLPEDDPTSRKASTIEDLLSRLRAVPGVQAAGFSNAGALVGIVDRAGHFVPPGRSVEEMRREPNPPQVRSIEGGYLEAMGIPLIAGRTFGPGDKAGAPPVAIVNRVLAEQFFGAASPIGATLAWYGGADPPVMLEVFGVIDNVRHGRIQQEATPEVIVDYRQMLEHRARWKIPVRQQELLAFGFMSFAVRTRGEPAALIPAARAAVAAAHPTAGLDAVAPMTELVSTSLARPRFYAALLTVFALIAAALAAIGVYGVLAYAVAQRTQEIGVRMALGAKRGDVMRLVLRRGFVLSAAGIAFGLIGAAGLSRYLAGLLYGVTATDAWTYGTAAAGFALVALLASWIPARRATRVDPVVALRMD